MPSTYDAYYAAPQALKDVIDSEKIGILAERLVTGSEYGSKKPKLIILITQRFLSLKNAGDLKQDLTSLGIDGTAADSMCQEIEGFISATLHTISSSIDSVSTEIAEAEEILESIPAVRTMPTAPTAPAETVYTSTQAAILHESTTPAPSTPNTTESRWDSAR